jgi:hypothetical protein
MVRLAVVCALLGLQVSIELGEGFLKGFCSTRPCARAFQLVKPISNPARRDLGKVEMQLFMLQQLHVALDDAAARIHVRAAHAAGSAAHTFPDVRRRQPPPRS